jgi:hypothetical protein
MSDNVKNLISAIAAGDAVETENAFNATMAEKISAKLDDMRITVAQGMFKTAVETEETPAAEITDETPAPVVEEEFDLTEEQIDAMTEKQLDEILTKKTPASKVISDFVHSDDPKFAGDTKKQRIKRALGAYYGMHPEKSRK